MSKKISLILIILMMGKKNKVGFTLIELLASILVLAIIISITVYVALGVINSSKKKIYKVTINEIESSANDYLLENNDRLSFLPNEEETIEYQCITVQNLIDYGYVEKGIINSKVNEEQTVSPSDYIYLERDIKSKVIIKNIYVNEKINKDIFEKCGGIVKGTGNINFLVNPSIDVWSKSKEITISYDIKNLNDVNTFNQYTYLYQYDGNSTLLSDKGNVKKILVKSNGNITATIKRDNDVFYNEALNITKIDNDKPIIDLGNYTSGVVKKSTNIQIKVTDIGSGVNTSTFTKDDLIVKIGDDTISDFTLTNKGNGDYELKINDLTHAGKVNIMIDNNKVLDNVENGNVKTDLSPNITFSNTYIVTYDSNGGYGCGTKKVTYNKKYGDLCYPTRSGYIFDGWYTSATNGTKISSSTIVTVASDQTLYAHWKQNPPPPSSGGGGGCQCMATNFCCNCAACW